MPESVRYVVQEDSVEIVDNYINDNRKDECSRSEIVVTVILLLVIHIAAAMLVFHKTLLRDDSDASANTTFPVNETSNF